MRTYGTLRHLPNHEGKRCWELEVEPQVIIRLKRIFPRVMKEKRGALVLTDTPEVAAELRWVIGRWPVVVDPVTAAMLDQRAREHDGRVALVDRVLTGYQPPLGADVMTMGIDLRPHQVVARNLAWETGRLLLTDPLGAGKTFSALSTLARPELLPALAVVPTLLPNQWARQVARIFPLLRIHVAKSTKPVNVDADIIIMNWAKLPGWAQHLAGKVRTLLLDEVQELRTGPGTTRYHSAQMVRDEAELCMGLTATPIYNWGEEVWNLMNLVDPDVLGTRPEFLREWCGETSYGERKARVKEPAALASYLREQGVMLRRSRSEVGYSGDPATEQVIDIQIDHRTFAGQVKELDVASFAERLLSSSTSVLEKGQAAREMDWRLRQATGIAKAPQVAAFVKMLLEAEEPIVLFGWHRAVYDLWVQLLGDHRPAFVTGAETTRQKEDSIRQFVGGDTDLLIVSLRAGAGIDGLQERSRVLVFGELDWAAGMHKQCIGRLDREGQKYPVEAYYLVADEGSDPVISDTLELKRQQAQPFEDPAGQLFTAKASGDRLKDLARDFLKRR